MEMIMSFLEILKLETMLGGLPNNTTVGVTILIIVASIVLGISSGIMLLGVWAERSFKLLIIPIVVFGVSFIVFYSSRVAPISTEKIILREYNKNTSEIKLNSTIVRGTEYYFMVLYDKGTSYNIDTNEVIKINSCDNLKYRLITTKDKFMIIGNFVETKATNPVIEVVCY